MDKIKTLLAKCKCGVFLTVNSHRDVYKTAQETLEDRSVFEAGHGRHDICSPDIWAKCVELDTIIELQFYPNTPITSYLIFHYDIEAALDEALSFLEE